MYFQGSVADAIAASRREMKPLIVLLTGLHRVLIGDSAVPGCLLPASHNVPCLWHGRWPVPRLAGFDQGSREVQDALLEQAGEEHAVGSIVLALEVLRRHRLLPAAAACQGASSRSLPGRIKQQSILCPPDYLRPPFLSPDALSAGLPARRAG
jgi:hypothetical protein